MRLSLCRRASWKVLASVALIGGIDVACGGATSTELSSSSTSSSGSTAGNGPGASDAGSTAGDPRPGGNTTALPCGGETCALPSSMCCVTRNNDNFVFSCSSACTRQQAGNAALRCSATANCAAGQVCCANRDDSGTLTSACSPSCERGLQLCDPSATSTGCPTNRRCSSRDVKDLGLPESFATCGGN
jgi:hypothetical protein